MPCTDDGVPYPPSREEVLNAKAPAMLCALVTSIVNDCDTDLAYYLDKVNWKEAGVTRAEFQEWWAIHQARDAERRRSERKAAEREVLRRVALEKLTPRERQALGLSVVTKKARKA